MVSANTDERQAVEGVKDAVRHCDIYGDKGFVGQNWQEEIASSTRNQIWTIHRENQQHQHSSDLKRLISKVRQRIEGVFPEIQNTGRNPERLLNKTVAGFATQQHVCADCRLTTTGNANALRAAKIASHTLRLLLRLQFRIDVQTFQSTTSC